MVVDDFLNIAPLILDFFENRRGVFKILPLLSSEPEAECMTELPSHLVSGPVLEKGL